MAKRKPDDYEPDAEDEPAEDGSDGQYIVAWGIEIVTTRPREKSHMFSARRVVLDGNSVYVELADGQMATYAIDQVRKVLAMKSTLPADESS